jgi:hypothetical protein
MVRAGGNGKCQMPNAKFRKRLHVTPAVATALTDHIWETEELVGVMG